MKRIVLFLGLLLLAIPARAQYLDGLPLAPSLSSADIMPVCQGGTAGHPGTCKTYKTTLGSVLTFGLFNQSLNLGSGTLTAANAILGGATFSGPLHMGAFVIDGTNAQFTGGTLTGITHAGGALTGAFTGSPTLSGAPTFSGTPVFSTGASLTGTLSGSPTFSGAPTFSGTPVFSTGASMSGTFSGAHTYSGALTLSAAATALTVTNNASLGGTLTTGTGVTNGFLMSASTLSVTGTGNPVMTIKGLGTGGINFQTGATPFTGFQLTDAGASAVNLLRVIPGATGNGVTLQAVGDAAAILNLKAGTGGNQGLVNVVPPLQINAGLRQQYSVVENATNVTVPNQLGVYQNINFSGNTAGGAMNPADFNTYLISDTVNTVSVGHTGWSYSLNAGFDGYRNSYDFNVTKTASSITGDLIFGNSRHFLHPTHGEEGTAPPGGKPMESEDTITASQAGNILTVTAAGGSVISASAPQTVITGGTIRPGRVIGLGTGTGGVGTYTMEFSQDFGSQTLSAGNYAGAYLVDNADIVCDAGPRIKGCQEAEWDVRLISGPALWKTGLTVNMAINDAYHGVWDDYAIGVAGTGVLGAGTLNAFTVGARTHAWPLDNSRTDTAMLKAEPAVFLGAFTTAAQPYQYKAGMVVNAEVVGCQVACWRSPGFQIDPSGEVKAGPLVITYSSDGVQLSASRVRGVSAVVTSGGGGYRLHDWAEDTMGGLWDIPSIVGAGTTGAATLGALTQVQPGYDSSCPAAGVAFIPISGGSGLKGTVTCATSNGIVLGAPTDKLGFYGATTIVKATPVGACAGNTGCQALRDALGNLGLINTGSISN